MLTPVNPWIIEAQALFDKGHIAPAEMLARRALADAPRDAVALNLIGRVAMTLGLHEQAMGYFRAALAADHTLRRAEINLGEAEKQLAARPLKMPDTDRYLLIKAWGYGFWSDVDHVLGQLLVAEITGRTPVIHWGSNSLFTDDPDRDAFSTFFVPVSSMSGHDLVGRNFDFFPGKWNDSNLLSDNVNKWRGNDSRLHALLTLNRPERVVVSDFHTGLINILPWLPADHSLRRKSPAEAYRWLISSYLQPRVDIMEEIEAFYRDKMAGRTWAAAHIRGTDKSAEDPNLYALHEKFREMIHRGLSRSPDAGLFLITDCALTREKYESMYAGRMLTTECARSATNEGVHQQAHASRRQIGVEVMKDAYLAARCDYFLGTGSSNVSCMVMHLGEWTPSTCLMLDPVVHYQPNLSLYAPV